ncbi:hypothetical protein D3C85_1318260 [compost metagenome]
MLVSAYFGVRRTSNQNAGMGGPVGFLGHRIIMFGMFIWRLTQLPGRDGCRSIRMSRRHHFGKRVARKDDVDVTDQNKFRLPGLDRPVVPQIKTCDLSA